MPTDHLLPAQRLILPDQHLANVLHPAQRPILNLPHEPIILATVLHLILRLHRPLRHHFVLRLRLVPPPNRHSRHRPKNKTMDLHPNITIPDHPQRRHG